jgi:hypothetical protein
LYRNLFRYVLGKLREWDTDHEREARELNAELKKSDLALTHHSDGRAALTPGCHIGYSYIPAVMKWCFDCKITS